MRFSAMGVVFISFPEDEESTTNIITKNNNKTNTLFINPSSKSTHNLFPKAQFIISLCVLLIFITFILFTISTINEPEPPLSSSSVVPTLSPFRYQHALQGMGTLYTKGTRSFTELIIAHVTESVTVQELKLFLKLTHMSKITSKSDILFMFHAKSSTFEEAIVEETTDFLKLLMHGNYYNFSDFDPTRNGSAEAEPIWGRGKISHYNENAESTRLSYGSVVGFYADELDPENVLSGFMDHDVPMKLRRWACYPMLLGRIRRNFKHVMLVDVKEILLLGDDSLSRVKNLSQDSVLVTTQSNRVTKNIDKTQFTHKKQANPEVIMGGLRGIRRLSSAMLIEIVRESMQHKRNKKKNSVTESTMFNQLVRNEFILKNVDLILGESIHSLSELTESDKSGKLPMVRRGNSNVDINSVFKKYLCSFPLESRVNSDC